MLPARVREFELVHHRDRVTSLALLTLIFRRPLGEVTRIFRVPLFSSMSAVGMPEGSGEAAINVMKRGLIEVVLTDTV